MAKQTQSSLLTTTTSTSSDMYMRDWRKALRTPPSYRINSRSVRFHFHFALLLTCLGSLFIVFFYIKPSSKSTYSDSNWLDRLPGGHLIESYNYTYPLSDPIVSNGIASYRFGMIADMDKASRIESKKNKWRSYLKKGYLSYNHNTETIVVSFDEEKPIELSDGYALNGRGMELSELVTFNGRLLTFEDRTGLVYELLNDNVIPWILLLDGNGRTSKGFKSEWATIKDKNLYVGSMGKEWTTSSGEFETYDPMYVKVINVNGEIHHIDWVENYKALRSAVGITWPGYMIHESGMWSGIHKRWFFLPRRCSKEKYNETRDEHMGCNLLLSANEDFSNIKVIKLDEYNPSHGFSSFKFIPGSGDSVIVALQTEELNGRMATFITAFTIDGRTLLKQLKVPTELKYEGLEFI